MAWVVDGGATTGAIALSMMARRRDWLEASGDLEARVGVGGGDGEPSSRVGGRGSGAGGSSELGGRSTSIVWSGGMVVVAVASTCTVEIWESWPFRLLGPEDLSAGGSVMREGEGAIVREAYCSSCIYFSWMLGWAWVGGGHLAHTEGHLEQWGHMAQRGEWTWFQLETWCRLVGRFRQVYIGDVYG